MALPSCNIRLAGPFASADLDRLLAETAPLAELREATFITVDLRRLERISARSVAVLVAMLLEIDARGLVAPGSSVIGPESRFARQRLEQLDVVELLVGGTPTNEVVRARERGSRPCQWLHAEDHPGQVAQSLTGAMCEVCATDGPVIPAVWWALNEIAQNVVDHAGTLGGGIAVAELTQGGAEFEVAIADHGIGICASLAQNPAHSEITSDLAALRAAMEAGVTARTVKPEGPQNPGGLGLFLTHALLRDTGGGMTMRSGTAELQTGADPGGSAGLQPMHGTLVTLRFRTNARFSLDVILAPEPRHS